MSVTFHVDTPREGVTIPTIASSASLPVPTQAVAPAASTNGASSLPRIPSSISGDVSLTTINEHKVSSTDVTAAPSRAPIIVVAARRESAANFDRSLTRSAAAMLLEEKNKLQQQQQQQQNTNVTQPSSTHTMVTTTNGAMSHGIGNGNGNDEKKAMEMGEHWHRVEDVIASLESDAKHGLSLDEVKRRQLKYGANVLTGEARPWAITLFAKELLAGFAPVLWIASLLCFLAWKPIGVPPQDINMYLACVLIVVVFLQALFNFYQEYQANTVLEAFKQMLPPRATVIRAGRQVEVLANELTVGDIVMLSPGAAAPADLRIINSADLSLDKSALTGESHAVPVSPMVQDPAISVLEASNLVLLGTRVVEGNGWGIVIRVGSQCIMSGIARMASGPSQKTTLHREINRFVRMIVGAAIVTAAIFFIAWGAWLRQSYPATDDHPAFQAPADIVVNVVGAIVAFIPEGLPVAVTMTLTIIAKKLVKRYRLVVTQLGVVETLGCVTLIASDKTGTLTQNAMALRNMCVNIQVNGPNTPTSSSDSNSKTSTIDLSVDTSRVDCTQLHRPVATDGRAGHAQLPIMHMLLRDSVLCNSAEATMDNTTVTIRGTRGVRPPMSLERQVSAAAGSPITAGHAAAMDSSSLAASTASVSPADRHKIITGAGVDAALLQYTSIQMIADWRNNHARLADIPFSSFNKYMITINRQDGGQGPLVIMKGAPERVVTSCAYIADATAPNQQRLMNDDERAAILQRAESYGSQGQRVLAVGHRILSPELFPPSFQFTTEPPNFPLDGLTFIGLICFFDPPRTTVSGAIHDCHTAGIQVAMVTGDAPSTAVAIAREVGIIAPNVPCDDLVTAQRYRPVVSVPPVSDNHRPAQNKALRYKERAVVIRGDQIRDLTETMWNWLLSYEMLVFARLSPDHKLKIVQEARRVGHIIAVTGDGINDAPALKGANVGCAMGSGTHVARQAAAVVLLEDDFRHLVKGVEQGRAAFDKLQKVVAYLLPAGSFSELIPVVVNVLFGGALSLSTPLMIVICIATDVFASIALVRQPHEGGIMNRPPRNAHIHHLVDWSLLFHAFFFTGMLETVLAYVHFSYYLKLQGFTVGQWMLAFSNLSNLGDDFSAAVVIGQSLFFVTLVMLQIGNLLSTRARRPILFTCGLRPNNNNQEREANAVPLSAISVAVPAGSNGTNSNSKQLSVVQSGEEDDEESGENQLYGWSLVRRHGGVFLAVISSVAFAILVTESSGIQSTFATASVPAKHWLLACAFGAILFVLLEARKWALAMWPNSFVARHSWR